MALSFKSLDSLPTYTALSTDVSGNMIDGAAIVGGTIFLTDSGEWKIILSDLTLTDFLFPVNLTVSEVEIGKVVIKDDTTSATATVGANGLEVDVKSLTLTDPLATEAKQDAIISELQLKADLTETQPVSVASLPLATGAATSANQATQIASASAILNELQAKADLTERQPVTLYDAAGNEIESHEDADGEHYLGAAIIQSIHTSEANTSSDNLAVGATFSGSATSTLGANAIQVYLFADQDCIVYLDQGVDGTNWDVVDTVATLANDAFTQTFASVAPYFRLRVKNRGTATTTVFRTAAGLTPILSVLPRNLSDDSRLETETTLTGRENTERHVFVSPTNSLATHTQYRLVGTNFDGDTVDPNFWTATVTNSGVVTQSGEIDLNTSATANGTAKLVSVRRARFVVGSANLFAGLFAFVTAGTVNNVRRCGAYDTTEGFFFQLDGETFSVGSRKGSSDTLITSGSFNGNFGPTWAPSSGAGEVYYKLAIEWTPGGAFYYVGGKLLHKSTGGHLTNYLTLPITFENVNSGGLATEVIFDCLGVTISREGELVTNATSKYIGTNATTILKRGAGDLHRITVTDNSGTLLVYDGLSAAGTLIANLDASKTVGTMEFGFPFNTGLTVTSAGTPKMTVVYE